MDRAQLYAVLDDYLAALQARDPQRISWASGAKTSENNVELEAGDGLWGTIDRLGEYDLRFADTRSGQVGFFGVTHEHAEESAFALRLKVAEAGAWDLFAMIDKRQHQIGALVLIGLLGAAGLGMAR